MHCNVCKAFKMKNDLIWMIWMSLKLSWGVENFIWRIWECKAFKVKKILLEWFECLKHKSEHTMTFFKSKAARIIDKFNGEKFTLWTFKCYWHPWIFEILWTDSMNLHLSMQIPKCWRSIKNALRKLCLSLALTWRTTKLRTSRVTKDPRNRRRPFTQHSRDEEFVQHLLHSP